MDLKDIIIEVEAKTALETETAIGVKTLLDKIFITLRDKRRRD